VTNGLKVLAESLIIHKIQYIVINYINLFVFDDEIEMKNRSTIQTLTFVQTNPDHLYMKLVVVHAIIHCFGSKKLAPCKNFSWLLKMQHAHRFFSSGGTCTHLPSFSLKWQIMQYFYLLCSQFHQKASCWINKTLLLVKQQKWLFN
jgi:hypothetical protein